MNYSVLMSVYLKEDPSFLNDAITSIQNQSLPTNDFVLVCDGPLTDELNKTIEKHQQKIGDIFNVVKLEQNMGLGRALNEGIKHCKNDIVARMDADDIAYPDRCKKQLAVFERNHDIDIVGAAVAEFTDSPEKINSLRIPPKSHDEIIDFAKRRNPFNHPCVMYKKTAVENAGGYQDFYLLEDFFLWVRMLLNGSIGYNIQEPLLWMRAGSEMYKRRGGSKYAKSQRKLFRYMRDQGFINNFEYLLSNLIRTASSLSPNSWREKLFKLAVRK